MRKRFSRWLNSLPVTDPIERQQAAVFQLILIGWIILAVLLALIDIPVLFAPPPETPLLPPEMQGGSMALVWLLLIATLLLSICPASALVVLRRGRFKRSVAIATSGMLLTHTIGIYGLGVGLATAYIVYQIPIVVAGLLGGRRLQLTLSGLSIAAILVISNLQSQSPPLAGPGAFLPFILGPNGTLVATPPFQYPFLDVLFFVGITLLLALVLDRFGSALRQALRAALAREQELERLRAAQDAMIAERTAELARANRLKDEFLASMSHELRTPLNTILGMSETLQEQVYGPLNERQARSLHTIEESGRHLLALINDILDLSKIGAGQFELQFDPVDLNLTCQASLNLVREAAQKKRLTISTLIAPDVTTIVADARRLKQILVNLLSNAVKFTPEGGRLGLEVVGDAAQGLVRLVVWDSGIGIAPEDQARLFQPFVQLDSRLAREYEGTGLGLALVAHLATLHGGSVAVESTPGQGSRFTVSLPWAPAPSVVVSPSVASGPLAAEASVLAAHPTIVLAEDNEHNITMTTDYLEAYGCRVEVARDGQAAIGLVRALRPQLVLMDIQIPGMDGLAAIRHLRTDTALETIPIIALTALAMPGDRERCLDAGASDYLTKPVRLKELLAAIKRQLL